MSRNQNKKLYYLIKSSAGERGSGWDLVNRERLQPNGGGLKPHVAWPDGLYVLPNGPWNMPDYIEPPKFICERRELKYAYDFDIRDGFFVVSAKMKSVLDEFSPEFCKYVRCDTRYNDGEPGPELWLCSVFKAYRDAVDLQASKNITVAPLGFYKFSPFQKPSLALKDDIINKSHVFRLAERAANIFCDEEFMNYCKSRSIKGILFVKIGYSSNNNSGE